MDTQNVTLKLPAETLKKAKILAAERRMSLSALLTAKLEEAIGEAAKYDFAHKRALKWLEVGWPLGAEPLSRDGLH